MLNMSLVRHSVTTSLWKGAHMSFRLVPNSVIFDDLERRNSPNYTVNHKKRDILFLTITLANLNRFL